MQSYIYKTAENCSIQADVYRVNHREKQPVIVWIHGGALMAGSRGDIAAYQLIKYLEAGFCVISIDYRLAPETKLPSIIADLQDALRWVREKGPDLLAIDPGRLAVIGHSAGGYLALMAGCVVDPAPRAIVSFYGYGDIVGPWYSQPDAWYCKQKMVGVNRAYQSVGRLPLTQADWEKRFPFYLYCRQQGLWPQEVSGQDLQKSPEWFFAYCPIKHVTNFYPPALLIHGDQDTDVPYELSLEMDSVLEQHHVPHTLQVLKERGHGFDGEKDAQKDPVIAAVFDQVVTFLIRNCQ